MTSGRGTSGDNTQSETQARAAKFEMMTRTPVRRLVLRLAVPTTISMMVTALYNFVDALYIGHLSTEATAGIGITLAYMAFIQALGFFFGHGSGNFISQALGAGRYDSAETMASVGFFTPFLIGAVVAPFALIYLPDLASLLGATSDIIPATCDYLRYIVVATPFMMSSIVLNNQLRLQGSASFAMVGLASGAVLNIILDPILIFALDMGVGGASLATCISQITAWVLLFAGTRKKGNVHIRMRCFKPSMHNYGEIVKGGLPSLCRQVCNSLGSVFLNYAAARYAFPGAEAATIAAFAVVGRIMMLAFSLVLGFDQGFQPVCGFNYGAKLYSRVKESYLFAMWTTTGILLVASGILAAFAPQIVALFTKSDSAMIEIGARVLRWQCLSFPLVGLTTATNMLFQNLRMTLPATLIALGRQGLFFIPAIILLPMALGLDGVLCAQAVADVLTFCLALPYAIWITRHLKEFKS